MLSSQAGRGCASMRKKQRVIGAIGAAACGFRIQSWKTLVSWRHQAQKRVVQPVVVLAVCGR